LSKVKKGEIYKALIIRTKSKNFYTFSDNFSFFTNSVIVSGYKPLDKIAEVLKMNHLATQTLKDLKVL
jgi:ribosomal protein L14